MIPGYLKLNKPYKTSECQRSEKTTGLTVFIPITLGEVPSRRQVLCTEVIRKKKKKNQHHFMCIPF